MGNTNTIFKSFINQKDYDGGITRSELKLDDSITDIWKLSSNENILGPSPKAMKAIVDNISNLHEYGFRDDSLLKEAICKAIPEFTTKTIFTANGGSEILELITRAFLEPGLECIISTPTFIAYKNLIESEGAITVDVPLEPINYTLDVEAILKAINNKTRILFITNPNNPTGTYTNKEQIDYLINSVPDHVVVVYDEVYYHFSEALDFPRAIDYINQGKNVIGVHSFSKSYGLAGIRLGYGISTEKITSYIENIKRPFMINTLSQVAGIAALEDTDHLKNTVDLIKTEKEWLYVEFEKLGINFWQTQTNFIFLDPPMDLHLFTSKLLKFGVMVRPCDKFGAPNGIRITIGNRKANTVLVEALSSIYKTETHHV